MPRFRADLQLSRAGADTPEKEHKKAFGYEAAFKAPHNPKVVGSSPASATKSVTVVDTISATVIFCLYAFGADLGVKSGVFRIISALCQG